MKTLQGDVKTLRGDVKTLQDGQTELKGDVRALQDGQTELKGTVSRLEVLLEDTNSRIDGTLEVLGSMSDSVLRIPQMANDITELKVDNKVIKMAVSATSRDLQNLSQSVAHRGTITPA